MSEVLANGQTVDEGVRDCIENNPHQVTPWNSGTPIDGWRSFLAEDEKALRMLHTETLREAIDFAMGVSKKKGVVRPWLEWN
jgi:hypothetical protein